MLRNKKARYNDYESNISLRDSLVNSDTANYAAFVKQRLQYPKSPCTQLLTWGIRTQTTIVFLTRQTPTFYYAGTMVDGIKPAITHNKEYTMTPTV